MGGVHKRRRLNVAGDLGTQGQIDGRKRKFAGEEGRLVLEVDAAVAQGETTDGDGSIAELDGESRAVTGVMCAFPVWGREAWRGRRRWRRTWVSV